ncbi:glycosyltransferase family 4 protein [Patescibacteria group bacterium]|nr:MAG: glycosyltransferase family 4 protein [Patescibacteria group bacterium]
MKVALVHDWLNTKYGGAERVLEQLAKIYPEAPIHTLIYNQEAGGSIDPSRIRTSWLQRLPRWLQRRSRYLLPLIPTAIEQFDLSQYDVVISSSAAFSKGVITKPETLHVCYCHTPTRFVWDYWPRYLNEQKVGPLRRAVIHRLTSKLRLWDYYSAERVDSWVANSQTTAARINKYYRQKVDAVIYPGVEVEQFKPVKPDQKQDYFVTLGMLTPYKKIDLAIAACNQLKRRLIVIGDGPDRARLEKLAGPTIEFAGYVDSATRSKLVAEAQALIFANEEDFGIAPVEAMAGGTAVIAYNKGGLTETVVDGVTGCFFNQPTADSLVESLKTFKASDFKTKALTDQAQKFSQQRFADKIQSYVSQRYQDYVG